MQAMVMADILGYVGQYGLPLVLLIFLILDYRKAREKWETERDDLCEKHDAERDAERARHDAELRSAREKADARFEEERKACANEREEWSRERVTLHEKERQLGERFQQLALDMNRQLIIASAQTDQLRILFERETKEARDARERAIAETGPHQPWKGPKRGA